MTSKNLALAGNAALVLGVFCPIVTIPFLGGQNYFQNGHGDGAIVLVAAGVSFLLIFGGRFRELFITGAISLIVPVYTLLTLLSRLNSLRNSVQDRLKDNPFKGLADVALQSVQIQWGWVLLIGGALVVLAAAWKGTKELRSAAIAPES